MNAPSSFKTEGWTITYPLGECPEVAFRHAAKAHVLMLAWGGCATRVQAANIRAECLSAWQPSGEGGRQQLRQ